MAVTAETIYQLIKSFEGQFPVPAPFVTVNVGTFDAASGIFSGLTTTVLTDPEPVEHGPHQHPVNPPPRFVGNTSVSVTIDSHWKKTITTEPAPHVPLAPVMLQFAIVNATSAWSVSVNGVTVNAPATQTRLTVSIWDSAGASWTVQAGAKSHKDNLQIQRPAGLLGAGVGAFTIPVLPVTIVYAPPKDSLGNSVATYTQGQTLGTTVGTSFGNDTSQTVPNLQTSYGTAEVFKGVVDELGQALSFQADPESQALSKAVGNYSSQLGQFTSTEQTGISDLTEDQMTLTQTSTDSISTSAKGGGPGAGDVLHFYKNLRMVWAFFNGRLRLCPLGFEEAFVTAAGLKSHLSTVGISQADAQVLLSFDPFAAGGAQAGLPADRFTLQETWEYGFGASLSHQVSVTRDTKTQTTEKSYTTSTAGWDPGPIFLMLGLGEKDQTTITVGNATGSDVSSTVTMAATLASGPQDYFVVSIWYDTVFGTFAFQEAQPAAANRVQGSGASPGQQVMLTAGGKVFRTVADKNGHFVFRARNIPVGAATLAIGSHPVRHVTVEPLKAASSS